MVSKPDNIPQAKTKTTDDAAAAPPKTVELPASLTVRQLADLLTVSAVEIIKQLMRAGIMANINQLINYDAAATVAKGFGFEPKVQPKAARKPSAATVRKQMAKEAGNLQLRPPIVTVMGHVDHGKTRLLDAIRQTNVMDSEAGGITQHIGAYQVEYKGQKITFLDTPGHEAFTAMRAHGAQITDITILVVAADDGVMPQTIEAISHARAAGVPIIVAMNKIDKPEANPDRVKQQLSEAGLICEDWGGDTICVPVSAKEKRNITDLLENVLAVAELEELKADPTRPATGVVVEARLDKSKGPTATILINNGTLKIGDHVVVGATAGRVRAMLNDKGTPIRKAEPATPVEILGLGAVPQVSDSLTVVADERHAQELVEKHKAEQTKAGAARAVSLHSLYEQISAGKVKELNVILKTDVQGSIEPIRTSLEKLGSEEVKVRIIHAGTGNITESDVLLAIASKGLIVGFDVGIEEGAKRQAAAEGIDIRLYDIIYSLIDDIDKALKGLLPVPIVEVIEGRAEVIAIFPAKGNKVAGVRVAEGTVTRGVKVRVWRGKKTLADSTVASLKRFKENVKECAAGFECGVGVEGFGDFQMGDVLELYSQQKAS
ncbi:MAG: translation initiation factor IF-2 [Chloroflexota bacterium]